MICCNRDGAIYLSTLKGWFESDYYYPTRIGPLMKGAGKLFDAISARMTKAR